MTIRTISRKTKEMISIKKILPAAFLAALVLLGACSQKQDENTDPSDKIIIGNIGEHSLLNLIAKEKEYFKNNGLDAQIIEYESGPPAIADLLAGKTDVAIAAHFVGVRNMFDNKDLRILTITSEHDIFKFVGSRSKGIGEPSDIKDKTVGVTKKGVGEFFLGVFLAFNNMSINDVEAVDLPPSEIVSRMETGEIEGALIFDPHSFTLKKKLGEDAVIWSAQSGQKVFAVSYTTGTFISQHKDIVDRYLKSLMEAQQYLRDNPQDSREILARAMNYDEEYMQYMWPNFDFYLGLNQELLLSMEDQARFAISNHLTNATAVPNYLEYIYSDALEKANPGAVAIIK